MYICICNAITEKRILKAQQEGHTTVQALNKELGVGNCCGRCVPAAKELLSDNSVQKYIPQGNVASIPLPA